jgi:hypothetical protein
VYLLRLISHDWPTTDARKILHHLAKSAKPSARVVIIDQVLPYACATNVAVPVATIPGAVPPPPPAPLLMSAGKDLAFDMDIMASAGSH